MRSHSTARTMAMTLGLIGLGVLDPAGAWAQGRWTLTPSLSLAERFDDNIFLTANNRESDFITEFTPGLVLRLDQPDLILSAGYSITGELYANNSALDNFADNQSGFLSASYRASQQLTLAANAYYARTSESATFLRPPTVPQGVTVTTLPTVVEGNEVVQQFTLGVSATYQFDNATSGTASYSFAGIASDETSHTLALGLSRQLTAIDQASVTASAGLFDTSGTTEESFSLLLGWGRKWTSSLSTSVALGPQVTDGIWGGAANLGLYYQVRRELAVSLTFTQGTSLVVGETEPQWASILSASVSYQVSRVLQLTGFGAIGRTATLNDFTSSDATTNYTAGLLAYVPDQHLAGPLPEVPVHARAGQQGGRHRGESGHPRTDHQLPIRVLKVPDHRRASISTDPPITP